MKFFITPIIFLIAISYTIHAQSFGLNLTLASPQGEFKQNVDKLGFGISGHALIWTTSQLMPFSFGLNVGFINYGNESRNTRISSDIPDVTVDVTRTNNLANFHLMFLISPLSGTIKPYLETLFGGEYLFTSTEIKSENSGAEVASSTNQDDFAWSYGGGGGLLIKLTDLDPDEDNPMQNGSLWLDLKVRYLFGTEAEYLREGSVEINNGQVKYNISRSKTDLLLFQLGVVFQID
jgi:hypothetical protein